jgi:hypothetical protein
MKDGWKTIWSFGLKQGRISEVCGPGVQDVGRMGRIRLATFQSRIKGALWTGCAGCGAYGSNSIGNISEQNKRGLLDRVCTVCGVEIGCGGQP